MNNMFTKILFYILQTIIIIISAILIMGIIFFGISMYKNLNQLTIIVKDRQNLNSKINFWQSIAQQYEGYKDAYFQIAVLQYKLGDFYKSKVANNKALILDPNFEEAKKLQILLNKRN